MGHTSDMRRLALRPLVAAMLTLACTLVSAQQRTAPAESFERLAARAAESRAADRAEEAIELYRRALSLRPRWAAGWFELATLLYDRDAYQDAAGAFGRAAALSPNVGTAWVMLGLCEFKLGRHSDALEHLERGRRLGVGDEPQLRRVMLYHEGLLLLGKGDFEHAQETLGLLSRDGVESEELNAALGLCVLRLRFSDLLAGDAALRELVGRAGRAEHLAAQKRFAEAAREYERLATDFPKAPNVQYAYGRFLLTSHDDERAVAALRREIENTPHHLLARLLIADTMLRSRQFEAGLPDAAEAVKLSPRLPLAHYLLGSLLLGASQTARAVEELETAARLMPDEPKIFYALSHAYERAGRHEDAGRALAVFTRLRQRQEMSEGDGPTRATEQPRGGPIR